MTMKEWKEFKRFIVMFILKHPTFLYNAMMYGCSGVALGWDHYIAEAYKCRIYKITAVEFGEEIVSEIDRALAAFRINYDA